MPQPNSLRELATRALDQANKSPEQSTPLPTRKRKLSSSPSSFRNILRQDFLINEEIISDPESPKDHLELLRSPEETPDARLSETLEAGEERLEASLELSNRQVEDVKTIDWSEDVDKEEDSGDEEIRQVSIEQVDDGDLEEATLPGESTDWSETIGLGMLLSISERRGDYLEEGIVSVTKDSLIEIKSEAEPRSTIKMGKEKHRKEQVYFRGCSRFSPGFPGVCWTNDEGKEFGLIFKTKELRDKLFGCIMELKKDGTDEDMGFGLFD